MVFTCVEGVKCIGIAQPGLNILIYAISVGVICFAWLVWILWKTPALEFWLALVTGRDLVGIVNKSQKLKFRLTKQKSTGVIEVKKVGLILQSENSHLIESVSGRPMYFCFGEFAATIPFKWAAAVTYVKQIFRNDAKPIHNIEDFGDKIGMKQNPITDAWEHVEVETKNIDVPIKPWVTIKLHDLSNMFPFFITPAMFEDVLIHTVAKKVKAIGNDYKIFIYGGIFLFIVVIAAVVFIKSGGGSGASQTAQAGGNILTANLQG